MVFAPTVLANGQAAVIRDDGLIIQLSWPELTGPMFHPTTALDVEGDRVLLLHDMGEAGRVEETIDLRFQWTMADNITEVQPYIMYGQSLAMNLGHDQSITAKPVSPGRALRYANSGAGAQMSVSDRPGLEKHDFGPCHFPSSDLDKLEDLHEERGESPVSAAVEGLLLALPERTGVVATNHARGGMSICKLLPKHLSEGRGTGIQYAGILRSTIRTRQFCEMHGCRIKQPIISFIQGETFQPDDGQKYYDRLLALQRSLTEDLGRITGTQEEVLMFLDQTRVMFNSDQSLRQDSRPAAIAQLALSRTQSQSFVCVGPKYFLPRRSTQKGRGDPLHLLPTASRLLGEYHGRAIRQTLLGRRWVPLHVASYHRDGTSIRLQVEGGDGSPLVVDTELVRQTRASLFGFRWVQYGGNAAEVTAVTVSGRQIEVSLSRDPGQAGRDFTKAALTIGLFADLPPIDEGPLTGGRTNIRDTNQDISSGGHPMFNWLCQDWFWEQ